MLTQQTLDKLYAMKLNGMADALKELIHQPHTQDLSFEERVALIVDRQWTWKEDRRLKRLLQIARLKINACTEDIDFRTPRGLDKSVILQLAHCEWIINTQNIIITGPTGVGKTYLACALANRACRMGFQSYYIRLPRLFQELTIARAEGSYPEDCPAMGPGMMGGSRGGQWIHSMKELNISADQRAAMKQIFERNRTRGMELAERGRTIRRELMDTVPDDAAYDAATEQAAAATAAVAADAVKMMAEMRRDVNAILTEDQRRQLRERTDADRKRWEEWRQRHKPAN